MFKILSNRQFFSIESLLHPYLMQGLKKNNLFPLRPCQQKAFRLFNEGSNVVINEMDGSGKTLSYIIPILNHILLNKHNSSSPRSGVIILTLNKQLLLNIYQQIRRIDFDNILNVNRSGSITHYSPVIDQMCKKKQEQDEDLIVDLMYQNVANSVTWPHIDILITTPPILFRILSQKLDNKEKYSPEIVVVDEADLILDKKQKLYGYSEKNNDILNKISSKQGKTRYLISTQFDSCLSDNKLPLFGSPFEKTQYFTQTTILNKTTLLSVKIENVGSQEQIINQKIQKLIKIMRNRLGKRVIIFCNSRTIDLVKSSLKIKLNLNVSEYYSKLSSQKRMASLFDFNYNRSTVLLTTQLANRGFSFMQPIDTIISLDVCLSQEDQINRMCRSNKQGGQYIVMEDSAQFKSHLEKIKNHKEMGKYFQKVFVKDLQFKGEQLIFV